MRLPKPLDLKKFYILLAFANGPLPSHVLQDRISVDSQQSLYLNPSTLYRLLDELTLEKLLVFDREQYHLSAKGEHKLAIAADNLETATQLAQTRLAEQHKHAIMSK